MGGPGILVFVSMTQEPLKRNRRILKLIQSLAGLYLLLDFGEAPTKVVRKNEKTGDVIDP